MSKIEVDHLKQTPPYRLQQLAELLDKGVSHGVDSDNIAQALRNYRAIVLQAYAQSLNDEVEKHLEEVIYHGTPQPPYNPSKILERNKEAFLRGPFPPPTNFEEQS